MNTALTDERLRQHLQVLPTSAGASLVVAGVVGTLLWPLAPRPALLAWLGAVLFAVSLRLTAGWAQRRDPQAAARAMLWLQRHRAAFALHGLTWAALIAVPGDSLGTRDLGLLVFALGAMVAGSLGSASFDLAAALLFSTLPVAAAVGMALRTPGPGAAALATMALLFVAVAANAARRGHLMVRESVRLRLAEAARAGEVRDNSQRADTARLRLAEQHQLMTQLLQTTRQGFWFTDNEGRTTDLNPAMAALLGRPREDLIGRSMLEAIAEADRPFVQRQLQARGEGQAASWELTLQRPDGSSTHCLCHATPLHDTTGAQVGAVGLWTDISERRRTEAELRRYELAVNSITDIVSVISANEVYQLVNDAWCHGTGVARAQALGRPSIQVLSRSFSDERQRALADCLATGELQHARGKDVLWSARDRVMETTYFPHRGPSGHVEDVVMVTRDITEQERSRAALVASEAGQRALLDGFPGYISRLDAQQVYTYVNRRMAAMLGRPPEGVVGRPLAELLGAERAAALQPLVARALAGDVVVYEHRHTPAGQTTPIDLEVTMTAGTDPQTGAPVVYGFTLDVTQRRRAEEALRESEAELRALLQAFPGYIVAVDQDNRYTHVNARMAGLLGRAPLDVVGRRISEVLDAARHARVSAAIERARAGELLVTEARYTLPAEEGDVTVEISHVAGPRQADGRQICYGFGIDISARKRAEAALTAARDEAESANRAKSQFLSQMSHELRTPLNAILGFGQLLASDPKATLPAHQRAWLEQLLRGAEHLLSLINEILDLGRIEAGDLWLDTAPLPLAGLVDECLGLVQAMAQARGVHLRPAPAALQGLQVRADRRRLTQVLLNLLGNAIKYNRAAGTVTVECRDEGAWLWLAVRDDGPGLTPQEQQRLFQPFERLQAAQSGIEGTGIGLALSRRLAEAMGGRIGVDSQPGVGSSFWLRLPSAQAGPEGALAAGPAATVTARTPPPGPPRTVLYIEDNAVNVALMEAMLARLPGLHLVSADRPSTGLRLAAELQPALVLLDIHLPEMDGHAVLRRLRAHPATAHTPVVAVSANALQSDIDAALAAGFNDYLTKPLTLETLLDTVQRRLPRP